MRVLILSVTAGNGHNSTAQALCEDLISRGVETKVEDLYQYVSQTMHDIIGEGYLFSIKHMKKGFKTTYESLERNGRARRIASILTANTRIAEKAAYHIREFRPDVIVVTHVFAAQVLNLIKSSGTLSAPVVGIITDYCIHPFWEDLDDIEYIVTGSELLTYTALMRGIDRNKLIPYGMPVRQAFRNTLPKDQARKRLKLDPDKKTVLVMSGSMGYGNLLSVVSSIDAMDYGIQLICICGSNEKLRSRMYYLKTKNKVLVRGFVSNVETYMDASDCIITKPGGLTVTEAMYKRLPLILLDPIPGHEERNAEFLVNNGAAIRMTENFSAPEAVYYLFSKPERLELMRRSIDLIAHPDASERICDHIISLIN